jgi:hypothetical protein
MKQDNYKTQDFYLCGFIVASGHQVLSYDRQRGITIFEFERTDELSQLVREYYADHATVSPIRYGNSLKNLKSIIYSNTNTNDTFNHNFGIKK